MRIVDPTRDLPRRELVEHSLTHGGRVLTVAVQRGKRLLTTTYAVERPEAGVVQLTKEDGTTYTVTPWDCDCGDSEFRGATVVCKHRTSLEEVGEWKREAPSTSPAATSPPA